MYAGKKVHQPRIYSTADDQYSSGQLRGAIERDELYLDFQPQLDLATGEIRTVEALVRWHHPERGRLRPDEFIPLAEHAGLIRPLTRWVLRKSVEHCRAWHDAGLRLTVAVNVSGRDLVDLGLADEVGAMLVEHGLDPSGLEVEVTESTLMTDPLRATTVLEQLSGLGIRIAIDDFGSGYSSLSHLRRLPVDVLKIDRQFVVNMSTDESDETIVRSTIDLAHNLGLAVVAEGVESQQNIDRLVELGCDSIQGYFVSEPVGASTLTPWLLARQRTNRLRIA